MDQENFNANQHANTASTQAELKLAIKRMGQIAAWEQIAVAKLHQANIKIAEHQAAHHQTFLRLRSCLQHVEAVEAHMKATMQARDSDIFWRLTNPLRRLKSYMPKTIMTYSRKCLKLVYWAATPWKIKARLQFIKNRNALQNQKKSSDMLNSEQAVHPSHAVNSQATPNIVLNASATDLYERIQKAMIEPIEL